jgi:hypothetical protein
MRGERHNLLAAAKEERIGRNQQRARLALRQRPKGGFDFALVCCFDDGDRPPKCLAPFFDIFQLSVRIGVCRIDQNTEAASGWDELG